MSEREKLLMTLVYLLREEVECLRSVLSEFDGAKREYVQMNRADIFRDARETLWSLKYDTH
jgi:hypothetical protein